LKYNAVLLFLLCAALQGESSIPRCKSVMVLKKKGMIFSDISVFINGKSIVYKTEGKDDTICNVWVFFSLINSIG